MSAGRPHIQPEPPALPGYGDLFEEVIKDYEARRDHGRQKYGTTLQGFNGRIAMIDLYQELLDATMYVKQQLLEQDELLLAAAKVCQAWYEPAGETDAESEGLLGESIDSLSQVLEELQKAYDRER